MVLNVWKESQGHLINWRSVCKGMCAIYTAILYCTRKKSESSLLTQKSHKKRAHLARVEITAVFSKLNSLLQQYVYSNVYTYEMDIYVARRKCDTAFGRGGDGRPRY
jgi:hypothetical protein